MNQEELFKAMSELDPQTVEAAEQYTKKAKAKPPIWLKWGALAACAVIVLGALFGLPALQYGNPQQVQKGSYTFDGKSDSWEIDFGEALEGVEWKAGELRTYTIKIDGVNVKIEDVVTIVGPTDVDVEDSDTPLKSYKNSTKTAVRIQNTGNTDVYIRAALIGQWLDEESGDPVFGYTDFTSGEFKYVDSWYQDQFVGTKPQLQGKFTDLPGTNWTLEDDGYYYYEDPIAPNAYIPNNLFTKYTVLDAPAAAVSGEVRQIYFQLEIATQAISAKKINGSYYTREEAWARANTPDPQEP